MCMWCVCKTINIIVYIYIYKIIYLFTYFTALRSVIFFLSFFFFFFFFFESDTSMFARPVTMKRIISKILGTSW